MYKLLVSLLLIVLFQSDGTGREWNENKKLTWPDFKGKPNTKVDAVAVTASGITFSYSIEKSSIQGVIGFKTKVFAHFYPDKSWCKKEYIDDHILAHEQLHFNVTELNVRYLRQKISKLKVSKNIASILDAYHKTANSELEKMQKKYDTESNFSINREGQTKWSVFVEKELKRLEAFKAK
jgi:hypothetical protein